MRLSESLQLPGGLDRILHFAKMQRLSASGSLLPGRFRTGRAVFDTCRHTCAEIPFNMAVSGLGARPEFFILVFKLPVLEAKISPTIASLVWRDVPLFSRAWLGSGQDDCRLPVLRSMKVR